MPATSSAAGTLTRAQIEVWDTTHLETAAAHWTETAKAWEGHFTTIHQGMLRPGGTVWEGPAAVAAADATFGDLVKVRGLADCLHTAAGHARNGAGEIGWAKRQVITTITEAEEAGFTVAEDLSVKDPSVTVLMRGWEQRQQQAQAFAIEIASRAQTLVSIDSTVAGHIAAALAPLERLSFPEVGRPRHEPMMQAVDYRFKRDGPAPAPQPPPGPSAADIRKVLDQLPKGSSDDIREVRSPADLQKLAKWMTRDSTEGVNRYGDPAKGSWKDLPDGSKVGERLAAKSTGNPALDVNLQGPNGGESWKVHINPQTGGEPNIPAPKPAVEAPKAPQAEPTQAPKPAPPQAGPAEPVRPASPVEAPKVAPTEPKPPIRGWGGPSAEPFGPQPVHPPGSIDHHFPILGVDDPGENPRDFEGHS